MILSVEDFTTIVVILVLAILVVAVAGSLSSSRFTNQKHKDKFKDRRQIGKTNIGQINKQRTYREIAKVRGLEESKRMRVKIKPRVTKSYTATSRDIKEVKNKQR